MTGKKVRVPGDEDRGRLLQPSLQSDPVPMPFGQVFTSLQTGLVQIAENGNDQYLKAKHYEAAPVLTRPSMRPTTTICG